MKKWITLIMTLALFLGFCACGAPKEEDSFRVGFGRVNITPSQSHPLAGYGDGRMSEGLLNYIFGTCVAITDQQNNTLLLFTVDMSETQKETFEPLREQLSASTGVPAENITISATHTHASPTTPYQYDYVERLVQAGEEAMADRAPATIQVGSHDVPNMNFVRHYITNAGTYYGDNFGDKSSGLKDHASEADETMHLIRFVREGDKKDVLMVNWQVHPKISSTSETSYGKANRNLMSSDFIGFARDYVEAKEDVLMAYYNGASGNLNAISKLDANKNIVTQDAKLYGEQFGDHVVTALKELKPLETGNISSKTAPLGNRGYNLHAYTVGSCLGFATVPAEIFCDTGKQIREGSPCDMTFVITCANGRDTYIPTENVWDYDTGSDELPYEVRICRYERGTAESLAKELGSMLTELAGK